MKSNRFKKPFIIAFIILVALFLAGLIGTPYLIDIGLERWITSQGPEIGKVDNVDFNPFTGRLSMDNLVVETQSGRTLNINHAYLQFSWKQLFKKQLYLSELVLQDTFMLVDRLEESGFRVGGLILNELIGAEGKSDKPGWEVGIGVFELQNARIEYYTPELIATYFIDQYTLEGLETWNKQKPVQMEIKGRINESPIHVKAQVNPLTKVKTWKGTVVLENGSLELISKVRKLQDYAPKGSIDIDIHLDAKIQEDGKASLDADGKVTLNNLQVQYNKFELQQENIAWQGKAEVRQQQENFSLAMEAVLKGSKIYINDAKNDIRFLGLEKFNFTGIQIANLDDIRVTQVNLKNLRLIQKTNGEETKQGVPPLLHTANVDLSNTSLQGGNEFSIGEVKLQDIETIIRRDKAGNWQVIPASKAGTEPAPLAEETAAEAGPLKLRIGKLQVNGKNAIHFADESLPRPFKTTFKISELELGEINTADINSSTKIKVNGQVGDYGDLAFDGTIKPSDKLITLDLKGTVGALDMVPFSSYTGKTIGYNVTSGQMDADITMEIDKGIMDGIFDLRMRNLEVAQVDPEKMPEIDNQMDVPLGSALAMLRNKKDEIKLKLELKGDIKSPGFGIQDAINQALAKAMKFATLSYLKFTLQPFGTYIAIAEVVGKAGKEMSKVGLDPVIFQAGEIVLDETSKQYLEKIKEVLDNRPKLRIELCGRAVAKDRTALIERRLATQKKDAEKSGQKQEAKAEEITVSDDVLLDFAKERAKLVKESLVKQHSIDHERIFLCLPEIDESPEKDPYVELLLD
jgi:hypothetical protein